MQVVLGSFDTIRSNHFGFEKANLLTANILAPVIVELLDQGMGRLLKRSGRMILAGIIDEQVDLVVEELGRRGLRLQEKQYSGDWAALLVSNNR